MQEPTPLPIRTPCRDPRYSPPPLSSRMRGPIFSPNLHTTVGATLVVARRVLPLPCESSGPIPRPSTSPFLLSVGAVREPPASLPPAHHPEWNTADSRNLVVRHRTFHPKLYRRKLLKGLRNPSLSTNNSFPKPRLLTETNPQPIIRLYIAYKGVGFTTEGRASWPS